MPAYETCYLNEQQYPEWDEFVECSKEGTIFHKSYWLKASNKPFKILVVKTRNGIKGGFVLSEHKNRFGQIIVSNPPLTPYQGIIYEPSKGKRVATYTNRKKISRTIIYELLRNYKNFEISLSPQIRDLQPFIWEGFNTHVMYTYLLKVEDLEEVWKNIWKKCRNDIRKSIKDNLEVIVNSNFGALMKLAEGTLDRQNIKSFYFSKNLRWESFAWSYFEALEKRNQCKCFITYDKENPIAGVFVIWDQKRVYAHLAGHNSSIGHRGATSLAFWKAIEHVHNELNLKEFDFTGSIIERFERYLRDFGGKLTPYYYASKADFINTLYHGLMLLRTRLM